MKFYLSLSSRKKLFFSILISLLAGALVFISIYGIKILNPLYYDWILQNFNDLVGHYIGWQFYRTADWTFPPGIFDNLSYPIKTTISNTDSIPLFAVFFKIFSHILPEKFQYFGLYGLVCFMLQSTFGMLAVRKFVKPSLQGEITAILSGILFTFLPLLPVFLYWHSSYVSHWLILMSFLPFIYYNELSTKSKLIIYALTAFIAGGISAYIFAFCCIITLFFAVYNYIKTKDIKFSFLYFAVYIGTAFCSLFLYGNFSLMGADFSAPEMIESSFNLNGFFNSFGFSAIFKQLDYISKYQIVGFAYLGAGMILLLIISLVSLLIDLLHSNKKYLLEKLLKNKADIITCLLLIIISFMIALFPKITFGQKVLFEIPLTDKIYQMLSIFRCIGRFIVIAEYIIVSLVLIYLINKFKAKTVIFIFIAAILLQIYDLRNLLLEKHQFYNKKIIYQSVLKDDIWNNICKNNQIKKVYINKTLSLLSLHGNDYCMRFLYDIGEWSFNNKLIMNNFYFARKLKGADENYLYKRQNPEDTDIFLFIEKYILTKDSLCVDTFNYLYSVDGIIIASKKELKGLEKHMLNKEVFCSKN